MKHPPRSFFRLMMGRWGIWALFLSLFAVPFALIWRAAETPLDGRVPGNIAMIAGGVAALMWLLSVRRARRLTALRRHGVPKAARVTHHTITGNKSSGAPIYRADWQTECGLEGHTVPLHRKRLPDVGTPITILVDPTGRLGSVWEAEI